MFFPDEPVPVEVVRELAAMLQLNGLGEISLESKSQHPLRLKLERETLVAMPSPSAAPFDSALEVKSSEAEFVAVQSDEAREIGAPCVGVYRAPKKPLSVGDTVKSGQIIGIVESLRVPNEVVAPCAGRVLDVPVVEGQGIEWGQTLLVLEPTL